MRIENKNKDTSTVKILAELIKQASNGKKPLSPELEEYRQKLLAESAKNPDSLAASILDYIK